MNYSTLDEAWNLIKIPTNKPIQEPLIEPIKESINEPINESIKEPIKEHMANTIYISHKDAINNCDNILLHILKCTKCQDKLNSYYNFKNKYNFTINIKKILQEYKDIFIILLICIFIILLLNLLNNITSN